MNTIAVCTARRGLDFSNDEILPAIQRKGILRLSLEIGDIKKCPLRCIYCCSDTSADIKSTNVGPLIDTRNMSPLSTPEIKDLIDEAKASLGTKAIELTGGGEPLSRPDWRELVEYISSKGLIPVIFTNAMLISGHAEFLREHNVILVCKLHSVKNEMLHDRLVCRTEAHRTVKENIHELIKAGYGGQYPPLLAIESVITRDHLKCNAEEVVALWKYCRKNRFFPYIEIPKLMGRCLEGKNINKVRISKDKAKWLFEILSEIDKKDGLVWTPTPPIPGHRCALYYFNCYVTTNGTVQPCSGVPKSYGNVRKRNLTSIVQSDLYDQEVRHVNENLSGKCGQCPMSQRPLGCYGCRSQAYWHIDRGEHPTRDMHAEDPTCWSG